MKEIDNNKYCITGYRVLYAYSLDDAEHRGYIKIADRIFHLDEDEVELAKDDAMILVDKVRPELPAGAKLEKIWFGQASTMIGEVAISARQVYDIVELRPEIEAKAMREEGADLWFKLSVAEADKIIDAAIVESQQKEQKRRDKENAELTAGNRRKNASRPATGKRPTRPIRFRPEQEDAIAKTVAHFNAGGGEDWKPRFLWNAKMRFGKTLSALEVAKQRGYKSILIITHRPVVDDGWHEDFEKIFFDKPEYKYGSRNINDDENIGNFEDLTRQTAVPGGGFVFFVSMQYLRLSKLVGGKEKSRNLEKEAILNYPWELVVIDEAHEGTKSDQGSNVMRYLWLDTPDVADDTQEEAKKVKRAKRPDNTLPHTLSLSGTPFNLYGDFAMTEIFTWDYVAEQEAKLRWHEKNGDDPNPYDVLPRMHIFNHDIEGITGPIETIGEEKSEGEFDDDELDETKAGFSFAQFFKVWTGKPKKDKAQMPSPEHKGRFMHEEQVKKFFYTLAVGTEEGSNYPFSTPEFQRAFRHTFWMIPGVDEAKALHNILEKEDLWEIGGEIVENPYYDNFRVINVAGSGDEEQDTKALRAVKKGIMEADRDGKYTITLSCGKLTTGVSIPQWTAVFYLKGNDDTRASAYLQTIFRVQTPAVIDGQQKTDAYVFDFSPTRSLRVFAEAVKLNVATKTGRSPFDPADTKAEEDEGDKWLKFMPIRPLVPGADGTMRHYDAKQLFDELNHHLTERAVRSGYADNSIYDPVAVMNLDEEGRKTLADLGAIINSSGNQESVPKVVTNPERPKRGTGSSDHDNDGPKREKTEEDKKREEWNREKRSRMQILRAMSVRIPLLMYGAEVEDEHTGLDINNFTSLFKGDRASWDEFMPPGVTPEIFDKLRACYNPSVFRSAAKQIREYARDADRCDVEQRIVKIAEIFSFFHNPDKETVLTPWCVVNIHLSDTLGGYTFFDETFIDRPKHRLSEPRFVEQQEVTERVFTADELDRLEQIRILELNSKTGLYPLYVAYSLYRTRKQMYEDANAIDDKRAIPDDRHIWDETLRENIFVVCKTEMARKITRRTLAGFRRNADGTPIQVNAVFPTWLLTEKELAKAGVIKMADGEKPSADRRRRTDLVGVLRARPSQFEQDVQSRGWWERQLNVKLDKQKTDMIKFNAVVGNPPYQVVGEGKTPGSDPIYHLFIDGGMAIGGLGTMIHPGRFLFRAGKTPTEWNDKVLNSPNFSIRKYWRNSADVFTTVDIKGGIAISLWDKENNIGPIGSFVLYDELSSIFKKVNPSENLGSIVYPRELYALTKELYEDYPELDGLQAKGHKFTLGSNIFELFSNVFSPSPECADDEVLVYGRANNQRVFRKTKRKYIRTADNTDSYKVFIAKANGVGNLGEILVGPIVASPKMVHNDTFLSIGKFETSEEATACLKYISTKFARTLWGMLKITQNSTRETWANVPIQDFTSASDIDWSQSVADIDKQLYEKYGLSQEEIDFIEKMIKPME